MDALYHYCSGETFLKILEGNSIRLSSLGLSNDSMEGKLLHRTLLALAGRDSLNLTMQTLLSEHLNTSEGLFEGLGFCLSEAPDLLSQWRAYADDGYGFAIGFNKAYFEKFTEHLKSIHLLKVGYINLADIATMAPLEELYQSIVAELKKVPLDHPFRRGLLDVRTAEQRAEDQLLYNMAQHGVTVKTLGLYKDLFSFKGMAFREEQEWRVLYPCSIELQAFTKGKPGAIFNGFRATRDKLIPYKDLPLKEMGKTQVIRRVVVGPKNRTPINVINSALKKYGFDDVEIVTSTATYR